MSIDSIFVLGILLAAIVLFVTEWLRVDVVALGVVVGLMLTGVLSTTEALSGFSNAAVLTIASLFVVGGAVLQTGLAGNIGRRILAVAGTSEIRLTAVLMLSVALLSGFMSDTGTVAVLLPAVISLARNAKIPPSKLLLPLAFGSLLGGAMTLIGTPPNVIVSDLLREEGLRPFTFFSFTPMGFILLLAGVAFMLLVGRRWLPGKRTTEKVENAPTPAELVDLYRLPDDLLRLRVRRRSKLVGRTLVQSRLRLDYDINVLKIMRSPELRSKKVAEKAGKRIKNNPIMPNAATVIQLDDILIVQGETGDISRAATAFHLGIQPPKPKDRKAIISREVGVAEVLLPPRSGLIGKSLTTAKFANQHRLTVLNINRPGNKTHLDLNDTILQFGDTLLVQGYWENIVALKEHRRDFVVTGQPEAMIDAPYRSKAPIALLILVSMVLVLVADLLPTATASMLAALMMVLTGCLTMDEAYKFIDWKSIVLVAGMLPMSIALQQVGLVDIAAQGLVSTLGGLTPSAVLAGLFLLTSLFTQVLSNTATAVIIAPVALAAARSMGVEPHAFLMAVAIAASMAFASPVASPVNTLVMGAGNYRFGDYIKIGVPLILLTLLLSVLMLPLLWPF